MAEQKIFRTKYVDELIKEVNQGINLERYYAPTFQYDESQVLLTPQLQQSEDLPLLMNADDNCASGIALYEAYSSLSPLQAADNRLWVYLAIADLFPYVRKKWASQLPGVDNPNRVEKMLSTVRIHWYGLQKDSITFTPMRHALANLWWSVYISVDNNAQNREDKYRYTRLFFKNETFRTRTAVGFLGRNREALYGILDFKEQCPEMFGRNAELMMVEITKFLNCLGGETQLSFMKRDFFLKQLLDNGEVLRDRADAKSMEEKKTTVGKSGNVDYLNVRDTIKGMINKIIKR